jgi:hypothetical protein
MKCKPKCGKKRFSLAKFEKTKKRVFGLEDAKKEDKGKEKKKK